MFDFFNSYTHARILEFICILYGFGQFVAPEGCGQPKIRCVEVVKSVRHHMHEGDKGIDDRR